MKWVYIEDHNGQLIAKLYANPDDVFNAFKGLRYIISTKQQSEISVCYRIYKV